MRSVSGQAARCLAELLPALLLSVLTLHAAGQAVAADASQVELTFE